MRAPSPAHLTLWQSRTQDVSPLKTLLLISNLFRCSLSEAKTTRSLGSTANSHYKLLVISMKGNCSESYVYWTMHHLDSWVKRDQLGVTCFIISLFNAQHVSDVNTSILGSLRFICWVISWVVLIWFDVCWCYVVVWLWWCGIRMQAEALPHHHSQTTT